MPLPPELGAARRRLMVAATGTALGPMLVHIPAPASGFCLCVLGASVWREWFGGPCTPVWVNRLLVVLGAGLAYAFAGGAALVAGLAMIACVKTLELSSRRDARALVFLDFFVLLFSLLFSQTAFAALWLTIGLVLQFVALAALVRPTATLGAASRSAWGMFLAAALPALVLFVLFPRFPLRLFGLAGGYSLRPPGLSAESLDPDNFAVMADVGLADTAFTVVFEDPIPEQARLYWRAMVFGVYEGGVWKRRPERIPLDPTRVKGGGLVRYSVFMEPHGAAMLYALDLPFSLPPQTSIADDFTLEATSPLFSKARFDISSALERNTGAPRPVDRFHLGLPSDRNPEARETARRLAQEHKDPAAFAGALLEWFRAGGYVYTLTPPPPGKHEIDEFLFETKRGFCGHFSSAYCFMARAGGLPCRIVAGFQGGTVNPVTGHLRVVMSDAHAWNEVLLPNRGWVRVDPTASAVPSRVTQGLAAALAPAEAAGLARPLTDRIDLFRTFKLYTDAAGFHWNRWVLSYDFGTQRRLFSSLGLNIDGARGKWAAVGVALLTAVGAAFLGRRLWLARFARMKRLDPLVEAYGEFCRRMAAVGLTRAANEGPLDFGRRIESDRPDLWPEASVIVDAYTQLRYGLGGDAAGLSRLVRRFRPKKAPTGDPRR